MDLTKKIRKFVYDHFYEFAAPPTVELIIEKFSHDRGEILSILYSLNEEHLLVFDKKINKIMIANPFAGIPTSFIVKTKLNRSYYATCAWDSIAMHITLEEDVDIASYCHYCNANVTLQLENEEIISKSPEETLIHFQYPANQWWDDIIDTCYNTMNFFCSQNHLNKWINANSTNKGYHLTDNQIMSLSILLYRNKMDLNYQRPTREEIRSKFEQNGLTGDFWEI